MKKCLLLLVTGFVFFSANAQVKWKNVDADFQPLPEGFHIFKTTDSLEGKPFIAYYAIADLKNKALDFTVDTTLKRRLTPSQFFEKNDKPLLVVNTTFFSFDSHKNLNVVVKNGKLVGYNIHNNALKGKDTMMYKHPFGSAIGISKRRTADVAWIYTDSSMRNPYAVQEPVEAVKDYVSKINFTIAKKYSTHALNDSLQNSDNFHQVLKKWSMKTAVGGGPVLVKEGKLFITNNQEMKFGGKAISDKHPRTLMGYTSDNKLIVMVIQGRTPGIADGATLIQEAQLMVELGCEEALNLDGGGSSCMLINGKQTIQPSDKLGTERAVPAVFIVKTRK